MDANNSNATSNDPRSDNINAATSASGTNISDDDNRNNHRDNDGNSSGHSSETIHDTNANPTPTGSHVDANDAIEHSY